MTIQSPIHKQILTAPRLIYSDQQLVNQIFLTSRSRTRHFENGKFFLALRRNLPRAPRAVLQHRLLSTTHQSNNPTRRKDPLSPPSPLKLSNSSQIPDHEAFSPSNKLTIYTLCRSPDYHVAQRLRSTLPRYGFATYHTGDIYEDVPWRGECSCEDDVEGVNSFIKWD